MNTRKNPTKLRDISICDCPHNGLPFSRVYIEDTSEILWKHPYTPIKGYFKSAAVNRKWKVT